MGKRITTILNINTSHISVFLQNVKQSVSQSDCSRRRTYQEINPEMEISKALQMNNIAETERIALTRLRLGSHRQTMNMNSHDNISQLFKHNTVQLAKYCKAIINLYWT